MSVLAAVDPTLPTLHLVVGAAMLLFGRRLFWVFVAGAGFVGGALLIARLLPDLQGGPLLASAAIAGLVGALVAIFAQKAAIALAGLLAGGYLGHTLALSLNHPDHAWIAFAVGAILGAILLAALFNWALIAFSSLTGAAVIAQNTPVQPPWPVAIFAVLFLLGLTWQIRQFRGHKRKEKD